MFFISIITYATLIGLLILAYGIIFWFVTLMIYQKLCVCVCVVGGDYNILFFEMIKEQHFNV